MKDTLQNQKEQAREVVWRRAERDILRRERVRLFRNGTIRPAGLPTIMAKDASGKWWPNSNFVQGGNGE